jgi:hypothetical protein
MTTAETVGDGAATTQTAIDDLVAYLRSLPR